MTHFDYDIGIIGGGAAGITVTAGAAHEGSAASTQRWNMAFPVFLKGRASCE